jgi:GT2 family glycosyltransferase
MGQIEVSIVIVCMNNINNLFPCIDSIIKYTHNTNYEIIVVAYLFENNNLEKLKLKYPKILIIESNEIRGFAENNNIALKMASGKYCFVLNDDTVMTMPVVDLLVESFQITPDASFMSPKTVFPDGRIQSSGRPPINIWVYFLLTLPFIREQKLKSKYTHQKGIFQSFNLVGAAFMAKTDVLKNLGFFDERYFFCPEDIALSTLANIRGYKCYVNDSIFIVHNEGGTASRIQTATYPAMIKGNILFYGDNIYKNIFITVIVFIQVVMRLMYSMVNIFSKDRAINMTKYKNALVALFTNKTPKEIFIEYYTIVKK